MPDRFRPTLLGLALTVLGSGGAALAQPDLVKTDVIQAAVVRPAPTEQRSTLKLHKVALPKVASLIAKGSDIRIVAFGSSSTAGAGASSPDATYPAMLETDLEQRLQIGPASTRSITVVNRGKGGDDAEAMAARLQRDVLDERPDLVIWQTGSNDPLKGVPVERFRELTRQGIAAIRATGADLVLMDQQWCRRLSGVTNAQDYADALHEVAAEAGVPVIRRSAMMHAWVERGVLTLTQMIGPDGLHMTDAGYRELAKSAAAQILGDAGLAQQPSPARN